MLINFTSYVIIRFLGKTRFDSTITNLNKMKNIDCIDEY